MDVLPILARLFGEASPVFICGFGAAVLISDRFSPFSRAACSRIALGLSLTIVFFIAATPAITDLPVDSHFMEEVASAFGLSFAITRVRLTKGTSFVAWCCGAACLLYLRVAMAHYAANAAA